MTPLEQQPRSRTLRSWKEVAAFLGVTERSAQRWEKAAGLPVHRLGGGAKGRILAHADELARWMQSAPALERDNAEAAESPRRRWALYGLLGVAALVVAAAVVLITAGRPGQPVTWALEGTRLTILDAAGRTCWEKRFPQFNRRLDPSRQDQVLIADIDGDRRAEILFNFFPEDLSSLRSSLQCFDERGRLRWEYAYGEPKVFAGRSFEPAYGGFHIRPVRAGGRLFVVTVANHYLWFPSQVSLLDAATGRKLEEYWHPGLIEHCALADLDRDGVEEVLFAGVNNPGDGMGHAALGVLSLPFSRAGGKVPGPKEPFPPVTGGGELSYALFPFPDVNLALASPPRVAELRVDSGRRILVETALPESGGVVYHLDAKLQVLDYRLSDNFEPLHNRLHRQRLLDHALTAAERESLGKVLRFQAAPDGNSAALKRLWVF